MKQNLQRGDVVRVCLWTGYVFRAVVLERTRDGVVVMEGRNAHRYSGGEAKFRLVKRYGTHADVSALARQVAR